MAVIYVASQSRGEGKTALCAALAHCLRQRGGASAALKAIASGDDDRDAQAFETLLGQPAAHPPEHVEGEIPGEVVDRVVATVAEAAKGVDALFVEGPAHLSVDDSTRLAEAMDAKVIVVKGYGSDVSASQMTAWRTALGARLLGFVINGVTRYKGTDASTRLLPYLLQQGLAVLGTAPEDRRLLGSTVAQIADLLDGRFVACSDRADALVEHLVVGGMGMDPGELYFGTRANKAVIVRGDRPDIQMSALDTPTACLVLTKGIDPIEYVQYEAEQEEVAVVVAPSDTLATMDALSALMAESRFDHPAKLARYAELLEENLNLPALFDSAGVAA